jgi:RimJ/RimL family protein N-acetyltransferase
LTGSAGTNWRGFGRLIAADCGPIKRQPRCGPRPRPGADLAQVCVWRNDDRVSKFLANRVKTHDEAITWFHRLTGNPDHLLVGIEVLGRLIGYGVVEDVDRVNRKCEIGLIIGRPDSWGRGIGRAVITALLDYCFGVLGLHRVLAVIARGNERSEALFSGLGFTFEGTLREATLVDGVHTDLLCYSMLEAEYVPVSLSLWEVNAEW